MMLAERTWFGYRRILAVNCELVSFINRAFDKHTKHSRSFHSLGGNERFLWRRRALSSCISDPGVARGRDNPQGPVDRCELAHSAETWSDSGKLRAAWPWGQKRHSFTHTHTAFSPSTTLFMHLIHQRHMQLTSEFYSYFYTTYYKFKWIWVKKQLPKCFSSHQCININIFLLHKINQNAGA